MASDRPHLHFRQGFNGCLSSDLYEAALAGKGTDMKFEVGDSGTLLNAHSLVIRTQSKVLDVMLNETWTSTSPRQQNEEIVLELPDDPEEFELFLKYLYGNQELNDSNFDVVIPVWKLADKYAADNLLSLFADYFEFLKLNFGEINVAKLLPIAHKHHCEELLDSAMEHVKWNLHLYWTGNFTSEEDYYGWPVELMTAILSSDSIRCARFGTWEWNEMWIFWNTLLWLLKNEMRQNWSMEQRNAAGTQVFENIRFCQLDHENFQMVEDVLDLWSTWLKDEQITIIKLAYSGVSEEDILKSHGPDLAFKVDRRLRHPEPEPNRD